jgi:hypothetical protein
MFSTAADGAVIVDTDGRTMQISGWGSGRWVSIGEPNDATAISRRAR